MPHLRDEAHNALYVIALEAAVIGANAINTLDNDLNAWARRVDDPRATVLTIGPEIRQAAKATHRALTCGGKDISVLARALREQLELFDIALDDLPGSNEPLRRTAPIIACIFQAQDAAHRALAAIDRRVH